MAIRRKCHLPMPALMKPIKKIQQIMTADTAGSLATVKWHFFNLSDLHLSICLCLSKSWYNIWKHDVMIDFVKIHNVTWIMNELKSMWKLLLSMVTLKTRFIFDVYELRGCCYLIVVPQQMQQKQQHDTGILNPPSADLLCWRIRIRYIILLPAKH